MDPDNEDVDYLLYHKPCHGELIVGADTKKRRGFQSTFNKNNYGITMPEYFEKYERRRRRKVEPKDRQLLKQLTTTTLFCPHCYRPFLAEESKRRLLNTPC